MATVDQERQRTTVWRTLRMLDRRTWARAFVFATLVSVAIAIPTRLIPNELFRRMTPTRPLDYVFWIIGAGLIGLALALRRRAEPSADATVAAGGVGTLFAVGCPVCNKLVVAILGVSGALEIFGPLQPLLAIASLAALMVVLRSRLRALDAACALTHRVGSESP
jgi:hypothetical protein